LNACNVVENWIFLSQSFLTATRQAELARFLSLALSDIDMQLLANYPITKNTKQQQDILNCRQRNFRRNCRQAGKLPYRFSDQFSTPEGSGENFIFSSSTFSLLLLHQHHHCATIFSATAQAHKEKDKADQLSNKQLIFLPSFSHDSVNFIVHYRRCRSLYSRFVRSFVGSFIVVIRL